MADDRQNHILIEHSSKQLRQATPKATMEIEREDGRYVDGNNWLQWKVGGGVVPEEKAAEEEEKEEGECGSSRLGQNTNKTKREKEKKKKQKNGEVTQNVHLASRPAVHGERGTSRRSELWTWTWNADAGCRWVVSPQQQASSTKMQTVVRCQLAPGPPSGPVGRVEHTKV